MIWYRASHYQYTVTPVPVVKETPETLLLSATVDKPYPDRRVQKKGKYCSYFPTEVEAWICLSDRLHSNIKAYERQIQRWKDHLWNVLRRLSKMEDPNEQTSPPDATGS